MIEQFSDIVSRIEWKDGIDLFVAALLIYQVLLLIRGTRGWQMIFGAAALTLLYYLTKVLDLMAVSLFLDNFIPYFIFALIVVFQTEIGRGLAQLGKGSFLRRFASQPEPVPFDEIVLAATTLASQKTGALIAIEREIGLKSYAESGIKLDAYLTYDLLVTIFYPKSPLHDGAVILSADRIVAAGAFLPLTLDPYLSKELGTRHRAAIGLSNETDCVAVVVSEETGKISIVVEGEITRGLDGPRLLRLLKRHLQPKGRSKEKDAPREEGAEAE